MKKFLIVAAAISLVSLMFASCTGKPLMETPEVKDKVEDAAATDMAKTVAGYFSDSISPNDVEKDVSDIDMNIEMNTEGLTETDDESGKACWYDSENKLVYEQYTEDNNEILIYHTLSAAERELSVKYADKDGVWTAYEYVCDDYTYNMDVEGMIFTIVVNADAGTISYLKTADTQWTISDAVYTAEDGTHEYTYSVNNGKVAENDKIIENS